MSNNQKKILLTKTFICMKKSTPVNNDPRFLFLTFKCPYCELINVLNKKYRRTEVVCTNLSCRRVISLELNSDPIMKPDSLNEATVDQINPNKAA